MMRRPMVDYLFEIDGDLAVPTELTRGGWSDDAQHGSPPAGLLARAIEAVPTASPMQVVRFTVDLFRPVPLRPLTIETEIVRDGRRIQIVDAWLLTGGRRLGRATALRIRVADVADPGELGGNNRFWPAFEVKPDSLQPLDWRGFFGESDELARFHIDALEIYSVDDSFVSGGPGESWFRVRPTLVAGEKMTPFQLAALTSDLANGNSQALDPKQWLYVNPDITLYLHRLPEGEWIGMRSAVDQEPHGIGVNENVVYDLSGRFGHINQAQLLERR